MYMVSPKISTRTPAEAKAWLSEFGVSVAEWAHIHGFPKETVYSVLSGRNRGMRGQAFDVAVALGIRALPPANVVSPRDVVLTNGLRGKQEADLPDAPNRKDSEMSP
jgi:gp16 family phage-associated protein